MPSLDHQLLKGSLDILLLGLLEHGPLYGYQIVKEVRARSQGVLDLKEGTLYPALHRLEKAGMIEGYWEARADGADRRYYRLTPQGVTAAQEQRTIWRRFTAAVEGVLQYG
ncbi:PadR family transcriptional regulator [Chloroflexales bacterium ZM16-3]|nr:PadR family transcriptional regulator [Chloroflexales bacterium ZM16-3]